MNNIERIIKYLSEEMKPSQKAEFERALKDFPDLKKEFTDIQKIWLAASQHLALDDLPNQDKREELIAEVIASYDISHFGSELSSKKELAFKNTIQDILLSKKSKNEKPKPGKKKFINRIPAFLIAVAAIIILLLIPGPDINQLGSKFYDPMENNFLEDQILIHRSDKSNGIAFFMQGRPYMARKFFEKAEVRLTPVELFFYALSCNETGDPDIAIRVLSDLKDSEIMELAYEAKWYLSLILIQEDRASEAKAILIKLKDGNGKYHKKARRLYRRCKDPGI